MHYVAVTTNISGPMGRPRGAPRLPHDKAKLSNQHILYTRVDVKPAPRFTDVSEIGDNVGALGEDQNKDKHAVSGRGGGELEALTQADRFTCIFTSSLQFVKVKALNKVSFSAHNEGRLHRKAFSQCSLCFLVTPLSVKGNSAHNLSKDPSRLAPDFDIQISNWGANEQKFKPFKSVLCVSMILHWTPLRMSEHNLNI